MSDRVIARHYGRRGMVWADTGKWVHPTDAVILVGAVVWFLAHPWPPGWLDEDLFRASLRQWNRP